MPKPAARVALVNVREADAVILREAFRQFGIHAVDVEGDFAARLSRERFEGCVVELGGDAEAVLSTIRSSAANRKLVLYIIASASEQVLRYASFGINAVFEAPLDRRVAMQVVRGTYLLVVNELRRYVRVPVVFAVEAAGSDGSILAGVSQEVSGGGMSVKLTGELPLGARVTLRFTLPESAPLSIPSEVCWLRVADSLVGLRFAAEHPGRATVKDWIHSYLGLQ